MSGRIVQQTAQSSWMHDRVRVKEHDIGAARFLQTEVVPSSEAQVFRLLEQAKLGEFFGGHFSRSVGRGVFDDDDLKVCFLGYVPQALEALSQVLAGVPTADRDAKL